MNKLNLAQDFAKALKEGRDVAGFLADDVQFAALNVDIRGREAVLARLLGETTGRNYREATWTDATPHGDAIEISARMPDSAAHAGHILLFGFKNQAIVSIQQQNILPARQPAIEPLRIGEELKSVIDGALSQRHPMLIAHVDERGQPVLSFRGSTQVFSDTQLAIWVRNGGGSFARSIAENPRVALMYRDEDKKATYQFQGRARIATGEKERKQVYGNSSKVERDHDFAEAGIAVIIDLDRIEGYAGLTPSGPVGRVNMRR